MFKLIIADDEPFIVQQLSEIFSWLFNDVEVAKTCSSAYEVIDYCKSNPVDIILTDIVMKEDTGLDIAEYVFNNQPDIAVILISAYADFEYAKQAIKYNVFDYVTKPINFNALKETFESVKLKIYDEKMKKPQKLEKYLSDFILGDFFDDTMPHNLTVWENQLNCCFVKIIIKNTDSKSAKSLQDSNAVYQYILNIFKFHSTNIHYSLISYSDNTVLVFASCHTGLEKEVFDKNINNDCNDLKIAFLETSKLETEFVISEIHTSLPTLFASIMKISSINLSFSDFIVNSFIERITTKTITEIYPTLDSLLALIDNKNDLLSFIYSLAKKLSLDEDITALQSMNFEEIKNYLKELIFSIGNEETKKSTPIDIAIAHINVNYGNDLPLSEVAGHLHMNTAYFSRYFKQKCGMTFTDYLLKIRIEKSKELLLFSLMPVTDIAKAVGITNASYFFKIFKNIVGCTPKEYREFTERTKSDA